MQDNLLTIPQTSDFVTLKEAAIRLERPFHTVVGWTQTKRLKAVGWTEKDKRGIRRKLYKWDECVAYRDSVETTPQSQHTKRYKATKEPTLADLDALVESQMCNLPKWWKDESERERKNAKAERNAHDLPTQLLRLVIARRHGCKLFSGRKIHAL